MTEVDASGLEGYIDGDVENIVLFISDSLRYDYFPEEIKKRGIHSQAISPSTFTGSSLTSILTGNYPAEHRNWRFSNQLPSRPRIFEQVPTTSFKTESMWAGSDPADYPPLNMLHLDEGPTIDELEQPFLYVEHDKGGHAPYGHSYEEYSSTGAFYDSLDSLDEIPELYSESVSTSANRFLELMDEAKEKGVFEDTLFIFTSDHGELLGEQEYGHLIEHAHPLVPELVHVPICFIHSSFPENVALDTLLSGVDIVPTIRGALGLEGQDVSGHDLWSDFPEKRYCRADYWYYRNEDSWISSGYQATSAWDDDGGVVIQRNSNVKRMLAGAYMSLYARPQSKIIRDHSGIDDYLRVLNLYYSGRIEYNGGLDDEKLLARTLPAKFRKDHSEDEIEKVNKELLEDLGYLE
jgi:hypothetical protein